AGDLTGALKMAGHLQVKDNALMAVGIAHAQAGRVEEALRITAPTSPLARAAVLAEVALAQARAGQRGKARGTLAESRRLREKAIHPSSRAQSLANHAIAQAECGDVEEGLKTFAETRLPQLTDFRDSKGYYYWRLGRACVHGGDARAAVRFADG